MKQCAIDWGLKQSTLKNYFFRPESKPKFEALSSISKAEGVSIEWLADGVVSNESSGFDPTNANSVPKEAWRNRLSEMLALLSEDDIEQLAKQLTLKGVETVLYLLDDDNIRLLKMDRVVKEKVLGLQPQTPAEAARVDEEARECDSVNTGETLAQSLASHGKRAG